MGGDVPTVSRSVAVNAVTTEVPSVTECAAAVVITGATSFWSAMAIVTA